MQHLILLRIGPVCQRWFTCAGHAGDVIGGTWFIVGGGNNTSGCTDTVALDLSPLAASDEADEPLTWSTVSQAEPRSAIVSEGLTVEAIPYARCLLSYGGYNGKYQSTVQIFKPGDSNKRKMVESVSVFSYFMIGLALALIIMQADLHATAVLHFLSP